MDLTQEEKACWLVRGLGDQSEDADGSSKNFICVCVKMGLERSPKSNIGVLYTILFVCWTTSWTLAFRLIIDRKGYGILLAFKN